MQRDGDRQTTRDTRLPKNEVSQETADTLVRACYERPVRGWWRNVEFAVGQDQETFASKQHEIDLPCGAGIDTRLPNNEVSQEIADMLRETGVVE